MLFLNSAMKKALHYHTGDVFMRVLANPHGSKGARKGETSAYNRVGGENESVSFLVGSQIRDRLSFLLLDPHTCRCIYYHQARHAVDLQSPINRPPQGTTTKTGSQTWDCSHSSAVDCRGVAVVSLWGATRASTSSMLMQNKSIHPQVQWHPKEEVDKCPSLLERSLLLFCLIHCIRHSFLSVITSHVRCF